MKDVHQHLCFFSDMDGVRAALPGAYSRIYKYYDSEFLLYPDVAGDMLEMTIVGADTKMAPQFNYISNPDQTIGAVSYIWEYCYDALTNINNIINYYPALLEKFPGNKNELNNIMANALFLRALVHFDLVKVYAQNYNYTTDASHLGIPIVLKIPGPNDNLKRNTVENVYAQILGDLKDADALFEGASFNENKAPYYASSSAVQGLLARVSLYMGKNEEAIMHASKAIEAKSLSQGPDYINVFTQNNFVGETIFKLNGWLQKSATSSFYNNGPIGFASTKLITLFQDQEDIRLDLLQVQNNGTHSTLKHTKTDVNQGEVQYDLILMRASEMYLIRAEANIKLNSLEEAKSDLKSLIARALQKTPIEIEITENTQEEMMNLLMNERAKELAFEGHRLFDLSRNHQSLERAENTLSTVQFIAYPSDLFILPIPQAEIDANTNILQNSGY